MDSCSRGNNSNNPTLITLIHRGKQSRSGCLGRADVPAGNNNPNHPNHPNNLTTLIGAIVLPGKVTLPQSPVITCDSESGYSAAITGDGCLWMWGGNTYGQLGLGDTKGRAAPTQVPMPPHCTTVLSVSLGSLYAACICATTGAGISVVCTWGYGGHGNLGHGNRKDRLVPRHVTGQPGSLFESDSVVAVACTRGQEGVKGGLYPAMGGSEGPHTLCLGAAGALYTFGTCHKGLAANLGSKTGAFGQPWDELFPYCVGRSLPKNNVSESGVSGEPPMSPYACWS
jgi:hypothetical protein